MPKPLKSAVEGKLVPEVELKERFVRSGCWCKVSTTHGKDKIGAGVVSALWNVGFFRGS